MANQTAGQIMSAPQSGVKVRMYRPNGLGDCFLLAFPTVNNAAIYVLIDCGVFIATSGGADRMRAIVSDIEAATNGRIDLLIATHEHWDHLSGFKFAKKIFDRMQIDRVWLAWTEDLENEIANEIREERELALRGLASAVERLQNSSEPSAANIRELLSFSIAFDNLAALESTADQMDYVRARTASPRYCVPGETLPLHPDVNSVQVHVLGPPMDAELLLRSDPSSSESEVYEALQAKSRRHLSVSEMVRRQRDSITDKLLGLEGRNRASRGKDFSLSVLATEARNGDRPVGPARDLLRQLSPFPIQDSVIPYDDAEKHEQHGAFFQEFYGFDKSEGQENTSAEVSVEDGAAWRRIDWEWLGAAADLALQLDNDTNNTSLALAIELEPGGNVLLFPGDAQVGNWLSWHLLSFQHQDGDELLANELLNRTVLYKVGHHGSHNATLRDLGLEHMTHPELTAMIPVDQVQAEKKEWKMPFEPLMERLQERTNGRIIRADLGLPKKPSQISEGEWQSFMDRVTEDPSKDKLWVEVLIST